MRERIGLLPVCSIDEGWVLRFKHAGYGAIREHPLESSLVCHFERSRESTRSEAKHVALVQRPI